MRHSPTSCVTVAWLETVSLSTVHLSVFKHIVVCVSTGLSLYFEDGHDDLDDCEYTELVRNFTDQHLSVNVAG